MSLNRNLFDDQNIVLFPCLNLSAFSNAEENKSLLFKWLTDIRLNIIKKFSLEFTLHWGYSETLELEIYHTFLKHAEQMGWCASQLNNNTSIVSNIDEMDFYQFDQFFIKQFTSKKILLEITNCFTTEVLISQTKCKISKTSNWFTLNHNFINELKKLFIEIGFPVNKAHKLYELTHDKKLMHFIPSEFKKIFLKECKQTKLIFSEQYWQLDLSTPKNQTFFQNHHEKLELQSEMNDTRGLVNR